MKVDIGENHAGAEIVCYSGPEEVRIRHVESKVDAEGKPLVEHDVLVALLNAASAAVASIPQPEEAPEGETEEQRLEREENYRKELEEWRKERAKAEAEQEAEVSAKLQAEAPAPPPPAQEEPQPTS